MWSRLFLVVVLASPALTHADTEAQIAVAAESGVTDNPLGVSSQALPTADGFISVTPSLNVSTETPRLVLRSTTSLGLSRYFQESDASSINARENLALSYDTSPNLRSVLSLFGSYSDVPALSAQPTVEPVPLGSQRFAELGAAAGLAMDLSPDLRGTTDVRAVAHEPLGDDSRPESLAFEGALSAQLSNRRDAYEARLSGSATLFEMAAGGAGAVRHYAVAAQASWNRELSPSWGSTVSAGGSAVFTPDLTLEPLGRLRLSYQRDASMFHVEIAQAARSSALLGATFSTSSAAARLGVRFGPRQVLLFQLDGGGSHSRTIAIEPQRIVNTAQSVAMLAWAARENLAFTLRYELLYQVEVSGPKLLRNAGIAGVTAFWPAMQERPRPQGIELRVRQSEEELTRRAAGPPP